MLAAPGFFMVQGASLLGCVPLSKASRHLATAINHLFDKAPFQPECCLKQKRRWVGQSVSVWATAQLKEGDL
jgi:hypothetical protein